MLSYPSDEVGNALLTYDQLDAAGINPYSDVLTLERYRELFGENKHEFTGVDYVDYYAGIIREAGAEVEIDFRESGKDHSELYRLCSHLRYPYTQAHQAHPKRGGRKGCLRTG